MAQQLLDLGLVEGDRTGDGGREGGQKINENFTELYDETTQNQNVRARVKFTAVTTATYIITDNELQIGHNIFGVNYLGAVTITLPSGIQSDRIIVINDESGLAGTNNITLNVA